MATFGYSTIGASTATPSDSIADIAASAQYTAGTGETISALSWYGHSSVSSDSIGMGVYNFGPVHPNNLLSAAVAVSCTNSAAWNTTSGLSQALTASTVYVAAMDINSSGTITRYYDTAASYSIDFDTSKALPATWSSFTRQLRIYSLYATVSAGGGPTYTLTAAQGSFSLTGEATTFKAARNITASQGSYSLTGESALFKASRKLLAAYGSYTLTGEDVTLTYTPSGATYTLTAGQGSYALTGEAAAFKVARKMTASYGSFTLTGEAAGLVRGYTLTAAYGTFTYTGEASSLIVSRKMTAAYGSYALTGQNATLSYSSGLWTIVSPDTSTWSATTPASDTWSTETPTTTSWS